ncbi:superoxide dismutase family protein [Photobacterium angustum]|uniref:Superoxide dismutase [Cu-Zn] n=1 Tax=Photobacterium angustum TaxID=661 RepID=A0A2S7V8D6_PHOAN|nr:superoxide dismutase family protein [Photobacterium angustum]PQJ58476.1 superoxide dismutase [Photobacterium angustum]
MNKAKAFLFTALALGLSHQVLAQDLTVKMTDLQTGKPVGTIELSQNKYGVVFTPELADLTPGMHGFHIHQNGNCGSIEKNGKVVLGGAAGGHYDPEHTNKHGFAWSDDNHKGDLPALFVSANGLATNPVLAPRLTLEELKGRSIMIHAGGDNHSDMPKALGGGGSRVACGVIQ